MLKICVMIALVLAAPVRAAPWILDQAQSRVEVDVAWLGQVVKVSFGDLRGKIDFAPEAPVRTKARIAVATGSASTGIGIADRLVRGPEYLDSKAHSQITFDLQRLKITGASTADLSGSITMLGRTQPATFQARLTQLGAAEGDPSRQVAGFYMTGSIDRAAFGNTSGIPAVARVLPVRIWLVMHSRP